jgi:hypothetical protein
MTNIWSFQEFVEEQLPAYLDSKEDSGEWYVLRGRHVTDYSVWSDHGLPEDYEGHQQELPPEDRDANPPVDGHVQIGTLGWVSDAFDSGDRGFVSAVQFSDDIETNMLGLLVAHESALSEEAIERAEARAGHEATADGGDDA